MEIRRILWPILVLSILMPAFASGGSGGADCLACHGDRDQKSGRGAPLYVDETVFAASLHGEAGLECVDCHADLRGFEDFPHAENLDPANCSSCHAQASGEIGTSIHGRTQALSSTSLPRCQDCHGSHDVRAAGDPDSRLFPLNIPETCGACHYENVPAKKSGAFVALYKNSVHYHALTKAGLTLSADCVRCHGGHDILPAAEPASRVSRGRIIRTCGFCHVGVVRDYREGVHGKAYGQGIKDVPVCTDCHSEHDIRAHGDSASSVYATNVAGVCSRCHDDETLSGRYELLTSRLRTFNRSFHGKASRYGETRVANCASCHGVHDIRPSSDPRSPVHPGNLAATCGGCHPGAGANFAIGKIHVVSERTENIGAYIVKVGYTVAIGGLMAAFLAFIASDLWRRRREK